MVTLAHNVLLSSLKDYQQCDESLTALVKRSILEPLHSDLLHQESREQGKPINHPDIRQEANRLSPLAICIVNQNIESLKKFKDWARNNTNKDIDSWSRTKWINSIKNCLFDTSFLAIEALELINVYYSPLKHLDIEKTTSNLICKLVDLDEWTRALDKLVIFRQHLISLGRVELNDNLGSSKHTCHHNLNVHDEVIAFGADSEEIPGQYDKHFATQLPDPPSTGDCWYCDLPSMSSWEETTIQKYADLFVFPMDADMNERSLILLVLAYQMNAIRSWCGINGGTMIKYLVILTDRPGNFIDWCKRLRQYDDLMANKQLDLLRRHLMKTADKVSKTNGDSLVIMSIQVLAFRSAIWSTMVPFRSICDQFVLLGSNYESSTTKVDYNLLQAFCGDLMYALYPAPLQTSDLEACFRLFEYFAHVTRKAKDHPDAISRFASMIPILNDIFNKMTITPTCSNVAYNTLMKLSLCTLQIDVLFHVKSEMTSTDLGSLLSDTSSSIDALIQLIQIDDICNKDHTGQVLIKLGTGIRAFCQSSSRFREMVEQQHKPNTFDCSSNLSSPVAPESSLVMEWEQHAEEMTSALQGCRELMRLMTILVKKHEQSNGEPISNVLISDLLLTYVHVMIVLAEIQFDPLNDDTIYQALEYLESAEHLCSDFEFSGGRRAISAAYYTLGSKMVKMEVVSKAVYPLRKACTILEMVSAQMVSDRDQLQLVQRYKILGTSFQKGGNFKEAAKAYRMALKHIPASTIDLFIMDSDRLAISTLIKRQPLVPGLINRFIQASYSDHTGQTTYSTEIMDTSTLTSIQICILYECEVRALFTLLPRPNLIMQQDLMIDSLLQHYPADQYPIRRTRTLLSKIQMIHAKAIDDEESIRSAIQLALEAQGLLAKKDFGFDGNLRAYQRHYMALAIFWLGILRRRLGGNYLNNFDSALRQWGHLLENLGPLLSNNPNSKEDLEKVDLQIDDYNGLYGHLRILADLFGLIGHPSLQINAMRLILKLNNGLRDSATDCYSDSVVIMTNIGRIYTNLGYSGKAGMEFSKAESILARYPCSNQAELQYLVEYSYYLSTIGDYEKSHTIFNTTRLFWDKIEQLEEPLMKPLESLKRQVIKRLTISDCHLVRSYISLHMGSLDVAISDAVSSYQVLNNLLESIKKTANSTLIENNNAYDKIIDPCKDGGLGQQLKPGFNLLFEEYQWITAKKLGACIERLAILHMTRGTWSDAQWFLLQGIQLGERIESNVMVYRFLLLQSSSYLQTDQVDKCKSCLDSATMLHAKESFDIWDEIELKSASGNLHAHFGFLHESIKSYDIVDELLLRMMDHAYINNFERLSESGENLEQHLNLPHYDYVVEEDIHDHTQYDCQSLYAKQAQNAVRKLVVMAKMGRISSGLKLLELLKESGNMAGHMNILEVASAHIRLMIIKNDLLNHINLALMGKSVSSLNFICSSSRDNNCNEGTHNILSVGDSLDRVISCTLATLTKCQSIETVANVEQLYLDAGLAMLLKNMVSIPDITLVNNHVSTTAFYLEMAKSIGVRRKMQNCLDQKLSMPPPSPINDLIWPKPVMESTLANVPYNSNTRQTLSSFLSEATTKHLMNLRTSYQQEYDLDGLEFQNTFVNILSPHWTVCSLSLDVDGQILYATQYRTGKPPLVLRLPLNRVAERSHSKYSRHANVGITYQEALYEFNNIMGLHKQEMHSNKTNMLKKDVEDWWMTRSQLDARLKKLLEEMERSWIGGFKGLFSGRHHISIKALVTFRQQLAHILRANQPRLSTSSTQCFLDIEEPILHIVIQLGTNPTDYDLEDIVYFLLAAYENQGFSVDHSEITIGRMIEQIRQAIKSYHNEATQEGINTMERQPNEHIILIPDKNTRTFPLESLPTLRSQPVSRLPCLSFLRDRILYAQHHFKDNQSITTMENRERNNDKRHDWNEITIDRSRSYYVLNPTNDLEDTQTGLEDIFNRMHSWEGCAGKVPSEIECRSMLMEKDLYMYFGPSAGQSFIRGQTIRQLPKCSVVLLLGCNNCTRQSRDECDQHGYYLDYLLAGSPAVVTNLWDMTDKNIHQVGRKIMQQWGLFDGLDETGFVQQKRTKKTKSLIEALSSSRDECQFPYLVGASSVVYGVPVYIV
ncbi:peptidase family C50-domain-containing protein [Chlamydoabsidia padenii]|nr:peptidase family C50-domain-containing protein [Chlamydoabsidia padenii]